MARLSRRLLGRPRVQAAIAALAGRYIQLVHATGRWTLICPEATVALVRERQPFIGAFWHGRMMMMAPAWRTLVREHGIRDALQPYVISSDHRDGRLMAEASNRFGLRTRFASTKRGGIGILRLVRQVVEEGAIAVVTPDGPRGPDRHAKGGLVRVAIRTGVPVVPVAFAAARVRRLRSWDHFHLALPFTRGVIVVGAPTYFEPDADPESARRRVEDELNAVTEAADRAVDQRLVEQPA